nr:MAG TPA: hypothetical protein [Caudoviricetes sp.]
MERIKGLPRSWWQSHWNNRKAQPLPGLGGGVEIMFDI